VIHIIYTLTMSHSLKTVNQNIMSVKHTEQYFNHNFRRKKFWHLKCCVTVSNWWL